MLRSLRPFKRRWTRGRRHELDIDATVQAYARTWKLIPQFRAAPERWFEADVVIDDSPSMAVWASATDRLVTMLEQLGAFRTVRTWQMSATGAAPQLSNKGGQPAGTGELRSSDGRRLIIVVSDGAASGWSRPEAWQLVRAWAESTPTALISPLPTRLWTRTGLGLPAVKVSPAAPGSPNRLLRYSVPVMLRLGADNRLRWLPVPAATFSAHMLGRWARTVMKGDPRGCDALLVPATRFPPEAEEDNSDTEDTNDMTGTQLVDAFRRTASPAAARLAVLCAPFSPLNLPILELLAQELVDDATPGDLAEVIVGGLLQPATAEPGSRTATATLQFRPGVRDRLQEILPEVDAWRAYKAVSNHVAGRGGLAGTFAVGFPDPDGDAVLPDVLRPFATASLEALKFLDAVPMASPPAEPLITISPPASRTSDSALTSGPARDDAPPSNASADELHPAAALSSSPRDLTHPDGFQEGKRARGPAIEIIPRQAEPVTPGLARARDLVLDAARRVGRGRFDVIAEAECGKTRLLSELAEGLRDLGYATLFVTVSPPHEDHDRLSAADRMRGDEVTYHQIIADLASDVRTVYTSPGRDDRGSLDVETGRRIERRMLAAATAMPPPVSAPAVMTGEHSLTGPDTVQHAFLGRDAHAAARDIVIYQGATESELLRSRWSASLNAFVSAMEEFTGHCPVAVLVDDLHLILGTGAGRWLLEALDQLPGIVAVHTRRPDPTHDMLGHAMPVRLTPMSRGETEEYVRHELPGWPPAEAEEVGSLVFDLTGGYPFWVRACCEMIAAETAQGVPVGQARERLLAGGAAVSAAGLTARFGRFVDDYCAGLLGAAVPVFDLLTVLRRVSRDLLASLLAGHGLDGSACRRLFDWLRKSAFMTAIDDGGSGGSGEPDIRLHDVIRHQAERNRSERARTRYRELHASAERYYRAKLNFDQEPEGGASPFQYGVQYEEPAWQASSLEWLHHAGQVDDKEFPLAMQAMIRLFLDAFWWHEADFPMTDDYHYCQALLAGYRALPRRRSGNQWLSYLEELWENYVADVPNRRPGRDPERWQRAQDALRGLWHLLRLDRVTIPDDHDLRRIQILLSIFRGDAEYYGGTGDERNRDRAAAWYTEAEQVASLDEDSSWIANWSLYFKANLYVDTNPATARELAESLPEQIDEQEDHGLRVYLIWLYGDLAWNAHDKARAFDIYARAVLHAFVYHLRQAIMPQNPSNYTVEYYQMFMDWTRRRLDAAREEGLSELVSAAIDRMNRLFDPYWARVGRAPDNAEGFPSQPEPADLGRVDSRFAETVLWMLDTMQDQLEEPLDGPLLLA